MWSRSWRADSVYEMGSNYRLCSSDAALQAATTQETMRMGSVSEKFTRQEAVPTSTAQRSVWRLLCQPSRRCVRQVRQQAARRGYLQMWCYEADYGAGAAGMQAGLPYANLMGAQRLSINLSTSASAARIDLRCGSGKLYRTTSSRPVAYYVRRISERHCRPA